MKKVLIITLLFLFLFSGCKVNTYSPKINNVNQIATGKYENFSYECNVVYDNEKVVVKALSTNANGLSIIYNGKNIEFVYENMKFSINKSNILNTNPSVVIFDVFSAIKNGENINISKIDGGYQYEGKISIGDFVLIQNDNESLKSLVLKDNNIEFNFR